MVDDSKPPRPPEREDEQPLRPEMAKLISAIVDKRRQLGFTEWESLAIEDVSDRIVDKPTETGDGVKGEALKPRLFAPPEDDGSDIPPII